MSEFSSSHPLTKLYNTKVLKSAKFTITKNFNYKFIADLQSENIQLTYNYNPLTKHHTFDVIIVNLGQQTMLNHFIFDDYNFNNIDLKFTDLKLL